MEEKKRGGEKKDMHLEKPNQGRSWRRIRRRHRYRRRRRS
jgi:hypothetical protein